MTHALASTLAIYGVAIVVSLAIALIIKGIVAGLAALDRARRVPERPAAVSALPAGPPPQHVAAIAAAVQASIGAHRVVHIERLHRGGWVEEGRAAHHASHLPGHTPRR